MKFGTFIIVALACAVPSAFAGNHDAAIEKYRAAYEQGSESKYLKLMADEYLHAGNQREALAYYCAYMYVDAAGTDADAASRGAQTIAAQLGNPTTSDHDACAPKKDPATPVVVTIDTGALPFFVKGPPISKLEIAGFATLLAGLGGFGGALYESSKLRDLRDAIGRKDPSVDPKMLDEMERSHSLRQKLYLGAGGALVITGGILYAIGRHQRKKAERALIAPTVVKGGAGFVFSKKF